MVEDLTGRRFFLGDTNELAAALEVGATVTLIGTFDGEENEDEEGGAGSSPTVTRTPIGRGGVDSLPWAGPTVTLIRGTRTDMMKTLGVISQS